VSRASQNKHKRKKNKITFQYYYIAAKKEKREDLSDIRWSSLSDIR
jgi:hypothetical protein